MLLSRKTTIRLTEQEENIIGHMCYAASKLWNICNYERYHYKELSLPVEYPDWYYQKRAHKNNFWYKQLPAQSAQEVCKILDKSWKSFYALKKSHGIENPKPPRYKKSGIPITYIQKGINHENHSEQVRLSLSKQLMNHMSEKYGIHISYLYLKNLFFKSMDHIKQIKLYPPENGISNIIVIYEIKNIELLPDNGNYLSIDLGLHNLMTCYDSTSNNSFIIGRKYLSLCHYFHKEISRAQSQWAKTQSKSMAYPKASKRIKKMYRKRNHAIHDYLHKVTRYIVTYCQDHAIHTVVIGDLTNIRKGKDFGHVINQQFHTLPYLKLYIMLEYKLALKGIRFIKQNEAYSSQTSPLAKTVCKSEAEKNNRVARGLYKDSGYCWNADTVGAFNILRLYFAKNKITNELNPLKLKTPYIIKVAV